MGVSQIPFTELIDRNAMRLYSVHLYDETPLSVCASYARRWCAAVSWLCDIWYDCRTGRVCVSVSTLHSRVVHQLHSVSMRCAQRAGRNRLHRGSRHKIQFTHITMLHSKRYQWNNFLISLLPSSLLASFISLSHLLPCARSRALLLICFGLSHMASYQ